MKTLDRELKVSPTFAHFRSEAAHAQAEAQSLKSFLAVWNRRKLILQTLGRPARRLETLDREIKVPRTSARFRSREYYKEYHVIELVHTECVGLINLFVDSLDHIYGKMPKLLEQHE